MISTSVNLIIYLGRTDASLSAIFLMSAGIRTVAVVESWLNKSELFVN